MSTCSLTVMMDDDGSEIAVMYRHMDGYPEWHGKELAEFLKSIEVTYTGYDGVEYANINANGMSCLAAQIVAAFKESPLGIYLYPAGTRDVGEEWLYQISVISGVLPVIEVFKVNAQGGYKLVKKGTATEVLQWIEDGQPDSSDGVAWSAESLV